MGSTQCWAFCYSSLQGLRHASFDSELANEMFTTVVGTRESALMPVLPHLRLYICICSHHKEKNTLSTEPAGG